MENRFPLFSGGRILKKESLCDIRDYAYESMQLLYADYTDGIIKGCEIRVRDEMIVIGRGLMKYGDFIYLLSEEIGIPYQPKEEWVSLKAGFEEIKYCPDYQEYGIHFFIDTELNQRENEIELCRFYLRKGSLLRDTYKDFYDMNIEYDTINLIHAMVAGREMPSLHPAILTHFARELWEENKREAIDSAFCFEIWNTAGKIDRMTIAAYLSEKGENAIIREICQYTNEKLYLRLETVLRNFGGSRIKRDAQKMIIVE